MKPTTWKKLAIIFIILFAVENIFFGWVYYSVTQEEEKTNICYYDFCAEYPEASYDEGVCTCYDYSLMGDYVVVDSTYLG